MKAINLKVEYLKEPKGIDFTNPRFFWNCEGGKFQSAYQIVVMRDNEVIWDTNKVKSSKMTHIYYQGKPLNSRDIINWKVLLWDENNHEGEVSESFFEMGLLHENDLMAHWISGNYQVDAKKRYPVDYFKKSFSLTGKIKKARLYATARGVYDVTINDKRIEDFILAPGITDYRKRIQLQTYDVTDLLKKDNELILRLADGWYRGSSAAYGVTNVYGSQTSIMAQLEIDYLDGRKEVVVTDSSFDWSNDGPIRFADLKDGEIYDATMKASYDGKAIEVEMPKAKICSSNNVYVTEHEIFNGKLIDKKIIDFGQNIEGYLSFKIKGQKGQRIKLICGETTKDGHVDLSGIQETKPAKGWNNISLVKKLMTMKVDGEIDYTPKQTIEFICSGNEDEYKTSFAILGFRYVEIIGDIEINIDDFKVIAVYSDLEQTGQFECSNEKVNKLFENTLWSMKGNFLDIPTDCPTRERLGWTGDAQIFFNTAAYLMNTAPFFYKWLEDMEDNCYKNGLISAVLPYEGVEMMYKSTGSSVGWADAIYLIPYRYYLMYGDKRILSLHYPMIKKYANYLKNHLGFKSSKDARKYAQYNDGIYEKGIHLGEWLEPEEFRDKIYGTKAKHPEECTAYLYYSMNIISEIAKIMHDDEFAKGLLVIANKAKEAYNACLATFNTNRQAKLVRPLALGLYEGKRKTFAQQKLKDAIINYRYRVGTGFLSTPFILPVLTEANEIDLAYKVLLNEEKPGWLAEVNDGATTIWENWEGNLSLNHYSPGAVCEWLFNGIGGINVSGTNEFIIKPIIGDLKYAQTSYQSVYGLVKTRWEKKNKKIICHITIPCNCRAQLIWNDEIKYLESGVYEFEL